MKKILLTAAVVCLGLLIASCGDPALDRDDIYTVTFHPNGGTVSDKVNDTVSMQTNVKGRLESLPKKPVKASEEKEAVVVDQITGEAQTITVTVNYYFTGWFTPGGMQISEKTVFHTDTMVLARWKGDDGGDEIEDGPLAKWLAAQKSVSDSLLEKETLKWPFNVSESIRPQVLDFGGKEITIELNGSQAVPTLYLAGFGSIFTVKKGVTLKLSSITLFGTDRNTASLIVIEDGGRVEINRLTTITNNGNEVTEFGGGVTVNTGGTLLMTAGEISGNSSYDPVDFIFGITGGGGILVHGGTFIMTGGRIHLNGGMYGGGVQIRRGGTFLMEGGSIYKNSARSGGGVNLVGNRVSKGETIEVKYTDTAKPGYIGKTGFARYETFRRDDHIGSSFIMAGGIINDNYAGDGGGMAVQRDGFFRLEMPTREGGIRDNESEGNGGGVIVLAGAVVKMINGAISNNKSSWGSGGVENREGKFVMYNGEISGNRGGLGGGVANHYGWGPSVFVMYDGEISNNRANGSGAGVANTGGFYMHGGRIYGNRAEFSGGAIYNGTPGWDILGDFVITGGIIYGKDAPSTPVDLRNLSGGIATEEGGSGSTITLDGGSVIVGFRGWHEYDGAKWIKIPDTTPITPESEYMPKIAYGTPKLESYGVGKGDYIRLDGIISFRTTSTTIDIQYDTNDEFLFGDLVLDKDYILTHAEPEEPDGELDPI